MHRVARQHEVVTSEPRLGVRVFAELFITKPAALLDQTLRQ